MNKISKNLKETYRPTYDREVVVQNPKILKKDEVFSFDGKFYINTDESIIVRSTNATGKIFKPIKSQNAKVY